MRYEVNADLVTLQEAGVDLAGLYIIKREVQPGQRRFVGRVDKLADGVVHMSEAIDETSHRRADRGVPRKLLALPEDIAEKSLWHTSERD